MISAHLDALVVEIRVENELLDGNEAPEPKVAGKESRDEATTVAIKTRRVSDTSFL
jgi:hypothetical protein